MTPQRKANMLTKLRDTLARWLRAIGLLEDPPPPPPPPPPTPDGVGGPGRPPKPPK